MTTSTGARRTRGTGSVRARADKGQDVWEVRAPVRDADGRTKQKGRIVRGTRAEAERALRELLGEVDKGRHRQGRKTVEDLFTRWLALVGPNLSPTTLGGYEGNTRRYIIPALGKIPLERLEPADVDELYIALRTATADRKALVPSSIRQVHAVLHAGLEQGIKWDWLSRNPASRASPPPEKAAEIVPPAPAQVWELITSAEQHDPDVAALIFLAAMTGMRRGELCALRWEGLDRGDVRVWHNVINLPGSGGRTLVKETKGGRSRTIGISEAALPVLAVHRRRMEARAAAAGTELAEHAFVFSDVPTCARPISPMRVTHRFARERERVGHSYRLHDIRHLQATYLLGRGVDVRTVSGRLGHSNGVLTLGLYAHFMRPLDQAAADMLGDLLTPDSKTPPPPSR